MAPKKFNEDYTDFADEDVVIPLLKKELRKGAKRLIQNGVSVDLIEKVFASVYYKVLRRINNESPKNMKDYDMQSILSKYYATQFPKELFGKYRAHFADILVRAVYATGYDYEDIGPFEGSISDFEDGFDLIGINTVSGGTLEDSFFVPGFAFKLGDHGFEKMEVLEKPKILLLRNRPDQKSIPRDKRVEGNIIDILDNYEKLRPNVILSCEPIDANAKKELAKRGIYFSDLIAEHDLDRVLVATRTKVFKNNYFPCVYIGTCKRFEQKKSGNEVFGILSGRSRDKVATIVLRGFRQLSEEAETYVYTLIPYLRSVMKVNVLVAGGSALYNDVIKYATEEANNVNEASKPIIEAFIKAIKTLRDKTCYNAVNSPSQKHAVAIGEGNTAWEPPTVKIDAIGLATVGTSFRLKNSRADDEGTSSKKRKRC